jgi:hypothetical protein
LWNSVESFTDFEGFPRAATVPIAADERGGTVGAEVFAAAWSIGSGFIPV